MIDRIKIKYIQYLKVSCLFLALVSVSCEDIIDVPPPETQLVRTSVFDSDDTAMAAMAGVYVKLNNSSFANGGPSSITVLEGVYSDELVSYGSTGSGIYPFYLNSLSTDNNTVSSLWTTSYNNLYAVNAILEGLNESTGVSLNVDQQLRGEALFLRAFIHFYLVNLFGDVPYIKTTNPDQNATVSRTPVSEVYQQLVQDLLDAKGMLTNTYPTGQRVRINKGAATALLARVYLYDEKWAEAEAAATEVISNTNQYELLGALNGVFLKNSREAIWQLIPQYDIYTNEGSYFILTAPPTRVALTNDLVNSYGSEDLRKIEWMNSLLSATGTVEWFYPYKYKERSADGTGAEYSMVLRLAEQYLIRAEARVMQNNTGGAQSDINAVRTRAGLGNTTASTPQQLMDVIAGERQKEFFAEWGHRFFDLKRWNELDNILGEAKQNWDPTDSLLPIPQTEIIVNTHLTQNPGY